MLGNRGAKTIDIRGIVMKYERNGFTLLELVVVIAILGLLMFLITPHFLSAREIAQSATCQKAMKIWGNAVSLYKLDYKGYLPREGASGRNVMAGAWYNELPEYVGAPKYGEVYTGAALEDKAQGGYRNEWIWYCKKRLVEQKNTQSGKNSFHYAMNAVLNGTGGRSGFKPDYGSANNRQHHLQSRVVPYPQETVFMLEPSANMPAVSPKQLDRDRHRNGTTNILFLDGHVGDVVGEKVAKYPYEYELDEPYVSEGVNLIWGPFSNY